MSGKMAMTVVIPGFSIPPGARAVLITDAGDGRFAVHPVAHGKSLLNLHTELIDHINDYPHSDAWLNELLNCCNSRLAARAAARTTGGLALPQADKALWGITP